VTHADLVEVARKWLSARGCPVVVTEMAHGQGEEADAIGWHHGYFTMLIECKASRSDFLAEVRKHRALGMGWKRYYMAPAGMIDASEIPTEWGLLEVKPNGRVRKTREALERLGRDWHAEMSVLVSACRRLGVASTGGVTVRLYTTPSKNRATVTCERGLG